MGKIACPKCGNGMSDKRTICEDCEAASEGKEDDTKKGDSYEKEAYEEKPDYTKKGDSYEKEETDEGEK